MDKKSIAESAVQESLESTLNEVLEILEADDGKSFEEKKAATISLLTQKRDSELSNMLVDLAIRDVKGKNIKASFWEHGECIPAGDDMILRNVEQSDRDGFLSIQQKYSVMRSMLKEEVYRDMVWNEHREDKSLMLSIVKSGDYIGYCGIKDTAQKEWEIAIELMPEYTGQGIGGAALSAMFQAIKERIGVSDYRVRIDPSNYASQKLFERLGAIPNGITEMWLRDQDKIEKFEEENLHLIDDELIQVAKKFGVEPRKLLSHVLEYRLSWQ